MKPDETGRYRIVVTDSKTRETMEVLNWYHADQHEWSGPKSWKVMAIIEKLPDPPKIDDVETLEQNYINLYGAIVRSSYDAYIHARDDLKDFEEKMEKFGEMPHTSKIYKTKRDRAEQLYNEMLCKNHLKAYEQSREQAHQIYENSKRSEGRIPHKLPNIYGIIKKPGSPAEVIETKAYPGGIKRLLGHEYIALEFATDASVLFCEDGMEKKLNYNCNVLGMKMWGSILFLGRKTDMEFCDFPLTWDEFKIMFPRLVEEEEDDEENM